MSRIAELEARRQVLLARCEEQRIDLAQRISQLAPSVAQVKAWIHGAGDSGAAHPVAWIAGIAGLLIVLLRKRGLLTGLTWMTGAVALTSRAAALLRVFKQLRAIYASLKSQPAKAGPEHPSKN